MANGKGSEAATKADVESLRTELKADVQAVKADVNKVAIAVVKAEARIDRVKQELLATMERNTSNILNAIDAFAKKGETYDRKALSHGAILTDHEDKLRDHGRRLTSLEFKP